MRFFNQETMEELSKGKRKRSLSAMDCSSDESDDGQTASYASSVTLCAQSSATETTASSEDRIAAIEKILSSHQDVLHRILSVSEHRPAPACETEDNHILPPARTPEDVYERTRIEAGFSNRHEYNAAYIHGLIRIDGERSKSITKDPACGPCASTRNIAVCAILTEDDPYYEYLVSEKRVCCGWCEYEKIQGEEDQRPEGNGQTSISPLDRSEDQKRKEGGAASICIDGQKQEKLSARQSMFFISGEGLDREIITIEIPLYLGTDSLVRPGTHTDPMTSKITEGYYITARRPPTAAMLADLRVDSAAWQAERKKHKLDDLAAARDRFISGLQDSE